MHFVTLFLDLCSDNKEGIYIVKRLFNRGKGDYHRLGHGTDEHVRKPKKVAALGGKKIIDVATGSLHCIAVSSCGQVFTWGDNDEGQQGDGTTNAVQRPRPVTFLQGRVELFFVLLVRA